MNEPIEAVFTYSRDEYIRAMRRHYNSVLQVRRDLFIGIIFVVSGGQPIGERELAILYAIPFLAIALLGPGRFSIDGSRGNA